MNLEFMKIFDSVYSESNSNIEEVLLDLKAAGASQMESTLVLIKKMNISLAEADSLVSKSKVWNIENRDGADFRDAFGDYLQDIK